MNQRAAGVLLAAALVAAGCSSGTTTVRVTVTATPSATASTPGSLNVRTLCQSMHGSRTQMVGTNGRGPTGWYCNGQPITPAQLQTACDQQKPGTILANIGDANYPMDANSQWRCLGPDSTYTLGPGHAPGAADVEAAPGGKEFYAVPNFYYFTACGRPCNQPLYRNATEAQPAAVHGWPCEGYMRSAGQYCQQPPAGRTASQRWDPAFAGSGDRVLVICQVRGESVRDDHYHYSNVWDVIAVPVAKLLPGVDVKPLHPSDGYVALKGPDLWFGNTGWHDNPC